MRALSLFLLLAGGAAAQAPITVNLNAASSQWSWSGSSTLGPIVGSPTAQFNLGGTVNLIIDSGVYPVSIGQFVAGGAATVSPNPTGVILNPMPFMPPIGTFEIQDLTVEFTSTLFTVAGNGDFTTIGTPKAVSGTAVLTYDLSGSGILNTIEIDMAGQEALPQPFSGRISTVGTTIELNCSPGGVFNFTTPQNSATMNLSGDIVGSWTPDAPAPYCDATPNSTGSASVISFFGSQSVGANNVTLLTSGLPANQFAYYLVSAQSGFIANAPGSQGNICLGGTIGRYTSQIGQSTSAGLFTRSLGTSNIPVMPPASINPGETWYYQLWHRDFNPTPTSNFSRGIAITFAP
jgi:hypothetical protein